MVPEISIYLPIYVSTYLFNILLEYILIQIGDWSDHRSTQSFTLSNSFPFVCSNTTHVIPKKDHGVPSFETRVCEEAHRWKAVSREWLGTRHLPILPRPHTETSYCLSQGNGYMDLILVIQENTKFKDGDSFFSLKP